MHPTRWLIATLGLVLLLAGGISAINAAVDVYGLYRPVHGRALPAMGDPRVAKFLLARRYVPGNYDAVLSGASIVANWPVHEMRSLRLYNVGMSGSNIVEERAIIEQALANDGIKVAFLLVHPAMTSSHEFHTVVMTPDLRWSSFGSSTLGTAYKEWLSVRLGRAKLQFDANGTEVGMVLHDSMNVNMRELWDAPQFPVDSIAREAYRELVKNLRAHHVQIVFVVPPTSARLLASRQHALDQYVRDMHRDLDRGDVWINFMSSPDSVSLANDAHFSDGVHLFPPAAHHIVAALDSAVKSWRASGQLASP